MDGKIYDYFDSNLSLSCQTYVLLIEHEGTMATSVEVSHSVDMDQDEVKVHRKKRKREKGPDFYPTILSERASSIKDLLQSRRNIAVSGIKNWYFVRCERTPSVFCSTFFLARDQCGQSRARKMGAFCPLGFFAQSVHRIPIYIAHGHCQRTKKSMYAISEPWCARISLKREQLLH